MLCLSCGRENRADRRFCAGCGAVLNVVCFSCGAQNEYSEAFCGRCGKPLTAVNASGPTETGVPTGSFGPSTDGERRQLTVVFCDLVGSTALSSELDPEDLRDVLRAYQAQVGAVVERYEGHVAQYLGDGVLAYFGYPQAHEDDARRAVKSALEIVAATQDVAGKHAGIAPIAVRLGLHTGPVVVDEIGAGARREVLALGETPNIAARLQALAAANEVVVSGATERLVHGFFACEALGARSLAGVPRTMGLFRVRGETGIVDRLDAGSELTPFIGREHELSALLRKWGEARSGNMRVVLLHGEPGIGKSRLVRALRERLRGSPHTRVELRCSQIDENSALHPLIEHMQRVFQFEAADSLEVRAMKLEKALAGYDLPLDEVVPLFADLLSLPLPVGYQSPILSPELKRRRTHEALLAWLFDEAKRQPVLFVVEDLHWADPSTIELLGALAGEERQTPILTIFTYRPEFNPPWNVGAGTMQIGLERLNHDDAAMLVRSTAQHPNLPQDMLELIVARAEGVPLFLEELARMLLDSGDGMRSEGGGIFIGAEAGAAVPATLQGSLAARLDRSAAAKPVAQVAAVLGREFSYALLQAVSGLDRVSLEASLSSLESRGLVYSRSTAGVPAYAFRHALIQDAAYASLLRSRRAQLHERAARVLQEEFPEVRELQPEVLAHHFAEAGLASEAVAFWEKAGALASARAHYGEATRHYRKGIELLADLSPSPSCDEIELRLQNGLGFCTTASLGYGVPEAERAYARAAELAQRLGEAPQAIDPLFGLWTFYYLRADHKRARVAAEQASRIARALQQPNLLVIAAAAAGWNHFAVGDFEAARGALEEATTQHQVLRGHPTSYPVTQDMGVNSVSFLAVTLATMGYADQAVRRCEETLDLINGPNVWSPEFSEGIGRNNIAWCYNLLGDGARAAPHAARMLEIGTQYGFAVWQGCGMNHLGVAKALTGESQEAIGLLTAGAAAWRAAGSNMGLLFWLWGLAYAYRNVGDLAMADTVIAEALDLARRTGEQMYTAEWYRLRGIVALNRDPRATEEAAADFLRARDLARKQKARLLELRATMDLHELRMGQGRGDESRPQLEACYCWFSEGFDTRDLRRARALLNGAVEGSRA